MKRLRTIIVATLVLGLSTLVLVGIAHAQGFQAGGDTTIAENKTVDGSLYSVGRTVDIAGTVNGDVYCAGQSVTISGIIHGDVLCTAQTIDISGTIDGSVRAGAQSVNITGTIGRNVSVASQTFTTHSTTKVMGDVSFASSSTTLNGSIGRDVAGAGSDITISAEVGRDLKVSTPNLTFSGSAKVLGNANYISDNTATIDGGATLKKLTHSTPVKPVHRHLAGAVFNFSIVWFLYMLLAGLFSSLVLILLLPKIFHDVTEQAVKHLGQSILTGFLAGIAVFVLFIALAISVIGIPLGMLLLLVWFIVLALSLPVTSYYIGSMVWSKATNSISVMLVGTLILVILLFLPIVGILVAILSIWIGTGSLLRTLKQHWPKPKYKL